MLRIEDIDRPLVEEGIEDAHKMGSWMKKNRHIPDLFITSPAVRAYGTAMVFARTLDYPLNKIKINKKLYECGEQGFLDVINSIKDEYHTVILFGHNPDITYAAVTLAPDLENGFSTAGIACIDFKVNSWEDIAGSKGEIKFVKHP